MTVGVISEEEYGERSEERAGSIDVQKVEENEVAGDVEAEVSGVVLEFSERIDELEEEEEEGVSDGGV